MNRYWRLWLKQCPGSYIRSPGHEVGLSTSIYLFGELDRVKCPGSYIRSLGDRASFRQVSLPRPVGVISFVF